MTSIAFDSPLKHEEAGSDLQEIEVSIDSVILPLPFHQVSRKPQTLTPLVLPWHQ